jgi:hypothetical protein
MVKGAGFEPAHGLSLIPGHEAALLLTVPDPFDEENKGHDPGETAGNS